MQNKLSFSLKKYSKQFGSHSTNPKDMRNAIISLLGFLRVWKEFEGQSTIKSRTKLINNVRVRVYT